MLGAAPLLVSLWAASAPAAEHQVRVTATILARAACGLTAGNLHARCSVNDPRFTYRALIAADGVITIEF